MDRFVEPADKLIEFDKKANGEFGKVGFAVLALDCLLIETIQGFRCGVVDHTGQSGKLFKSFLKAWPAFKECFPDDVNARADSIYKGLRCALHHSGQTDDILVRQTVPEAQMFAVEGGLTEVNRTLFHQQVKDELERYLCQIEAGDNKDLLKNLKIKMDAICGLTNKT